MKLHYYPETDSLYIELRPGTGVEMREIADSLKADLEIERGGWSASISMTPRPIST